MNNQVKVLFGAVVFLLAFVIGYIAMSIGYKNTEIRLRNQIAAQQEANALVYDKVWKIIQQKAQVTNAYKDSFKEIYVELMEGRYAQGGEFMKWIQESNPALDASVYKDLMNSIESLRGEFANVQIRLRDLKREHDNLIQTFPGSFFLAGIQPIEVQLVTSSKTKQTFETGEENDTDLLK